MEEGQLDSTLKFEDLDIKGLIIQAKSLNSLYEKVMFVRKKEPEDRWVEDDFPKKAVRSVKFVAFKKSDGKIIFACRYGYEHKVIKKNAGIESGELVDAGFIRFKFGGPQDLLTKMELWNRSETYGEGTDEARSELQKKLNEILLPLLNGRLSKTGKTDNQ